MDYRPLGPTGLSVSKLSLGGSSLGGAFGDVDEDEAIRTVHVALDLGINLVDVSPFYGETKAEMVLGKALREVRRDRYILSTKVGRYGADAFDFSAERVTRSVDESLARLGVETIDVILCHDIEFGDLDQVVSETIPALRRVRDAGKVRWIGVSGLPLAIFPFVLDRTDLDVVLSYCHYTLNDTTLETLLPDLERRRVGVINAAAVAMGLLTDGGPPHWHPAGADIRAACARAAALCRERGSDLAKLAIQFAVSNPRIPTTLVGAARTDIVRRNVAWSGEPIDQSLLADVMAILAPIKDKTWPTGRPENSERR